MTTIRLSTAEAGEILGRVRPAASTVPGSFLRYLHLCNSPIGLIWSATDNLRYFSLAGRGVILSEGGALPAVDSSEADDAGRSGVLIDPLLLDFGFQASSKLGGDGFTLVIGEDVVCLELPGVAAYRELPVALFPEAGDLLLAGVHRGGGWVRAAGPQLFAAVHACTTFGGPEGDARPINLRVPEDADWSVLEIRTPWEHGPDVFASVDCTHDGALDLTVDPVLLRSLLDANGGDEQVLRNEGPDRPLVSTSTDGFSGLVMPIQFDRTRLVSVVAEYLGSEPDDVLVDDDGDIPIEIDGQVVYLQGVRGPDPFGRTATVEFFSIVGTDLDESPDLLRELNALNARTRYSRLVWQDGLVLLKAEYDVATLDPEEIDSVCREIAFHTREYGPLIQVFHGRTHEGEAS